MAARDPDTGQFVEGMDDNPLAYADLRWETISLDRSLTASGGANESRAFNDEFEPVEGRLDPDQAAEVVYLRRMYTAQVVLSDEQTATATGSAEVSAELSINTGQGEWVLSDTRSYPENRLFPENLDTVEGRVAEDFKDSTNGVGGGGGPCSFTAEREIVFPDGAPIDVGPVLDVNDGLNVRTEVTKDQLAHDLKYRLHYQIGYRIHDIPDRRPSLGL